MYILLSPQEEEFIDVDIQQHIHQINEFMKWRAIGANVGGVGGVLAWLACLRGWCASMGGVGGVGGVDNVLACVAC